MSSNFIIDKATKSDYKAITNLLLKTNLPLEGIESHLENFLIVRNVTAGDSQGTLIACAGLEIYGNSTLLRSVAVHPDFQGKGYGSQLVDEMIELARKKHITRLFLLTDTAEEYFKKRGFVTVSRDKIPSDMKNSVEFTFLCASSPTMMREL